MGAHLFGGGRVCVLTAGRVLHSQATVSLLFLDTKILGIFSYSIISVLFEVLEFFLLKEAL